MVYYSLEYTCTANSGAYLVVEADVLVLLHLIEADN
jgi:hypothetical protein